MPLDTYNEHNSDHPANQKEIERSVEDILCDLSISDYHVISEFMTDLKETMAHNTERTLFWRNSMRRLLELQEFPIALTSDEQQELNKLKTDLKQILGL